MRVLVAALVGGIVALAGGRARAERTMSALPNGAASVLLALEYDKVWQREHTGGLSHVGTAGILARGILGKRVGWAAIVDLRFGGGVSPSFVIEADLLPVGLGVRIGRAAMLAVAGGAGLSTATRRVPFSAQFPVEAYLESDLGARVRVALFARAAWLTDSARQGGSVTFEFADEVTAGLGLRFGRRFAFADGSASRGTFVGVSYREQMGTRLLGFVLGFSLAAFA